MCTHIKCYGVRGTKWIKKNGTISMEEKTNETKN